MNFNILFLIGTAKVYEIEQQFVFGLTSKRLWQASNFVFPVNINKNQSQDKSDTPKVRRMQAVCVCIFKRDV